MNKLESLLKGGDLRSLGKSDKVISLIDSQEKFDELFQLLFHRDRLVVMRAADAIEKITLTETKFLKPHKRKILKLCERPSPIELKWHLALLAPRLNLTETEFGKVWHILTNWLTDQKESRIVRVHSLQGLFNLLKQKKELEQDFNLTLKEIEKENIPSINARIRILKKVRQ